jgi:hypothetical protein
MIMTDSMKNSGVLYPRPGQENATEGILVRNFKKQESKNPEREEALRSGCVALLHKQHLTKTRHKLLKANPELIAKKNGKFRGLWLPPEKIAELSSYSKMK